MQQWPGGVPCPIHWSHGAIAANTVWTISFISFLKSSDWFDFGHCIYILVDYGEYFTYSWLGPELMIEGLSIISILLLEIWINLFKRKLCQEYYPVSWYWSVAQWSPPSQSPGVCHVVNTGVMCWHSQESGKTAVSESGQWSDRGDSEWCHNGVTIRLQKRLSRVMSSSWQRWFVVTRRTLWSEIVTLELRQQLR